MGWTQQIEYTEVSDIALPPPVKKQVWDEDTQSFMPMTLYKHKGLISNNAEEWMYKTFGRPGVYKDGRFWDFSRAGDFTLMDEKVFMWFQMKWGNK